MAGKLAGLFNSTNLFENLLQEVLTRKPNREWSRLAEEYDLHVPWVDPLGCLHRREHFRYEVVHRKGLKGHNDATFEILGGQLLQTLAFEDEADGDAVDVAGLFNRLS